MNFSTFSVEGICIKKVQSVISKDIRKKAQDKKKLRLPILAKKPFKKHGMTAILAI